MMRDFDKDLAESLKMSKAKWWLPLYQEAFPGCHSITNMCFDDASQKMGIDRLVTLSDGTVLSVDEKVRKADYGDIAIERWYDKDRRKPGWIQKKGMRIDYINYVVLPGKFCWIIPYEPLRKAWFEYGREWVLFAENGMFNFQIRTSLNEDWTTENVCVPMWEILGKVEGIRKVEWAENDTQANE